MSGTSEQPGMWAELEREFLACHRDPTNVALHLLTTPLGLFGAFGLAALVHPMAAAGLALVYALSLVSVAPRGLWLASTVLLGGIAAAAMQATQVLDAPWWAYAAALAAGYLLQDAAHGISGEKTFQSTYQGDEDGKFQRLALRDLGIHTWLLVPLVFAAVVPHLSRLRVFLPRVRIVDTTLHDAVALADIELVRRWVAEQEPSEDHTTHWWFHDPPADIQAALQRLAESEELRAAFERVHPGWAVEIVPEMNEIYVAAANAQRSSDTVFYMPHVDGPFAVWPFATVYRGLLAVTENSRVQTRFIHPTVHNEPLSYVLTKADFLAFDFNREPHYICDLPGRQDPEQRCVLKLHYVVYPKFLRTWGELLARATGYYDDRARALFVATLTPKNLIQRAATNLVLGTTKTFNFLGLHAGLTNLAYIAALGIASAASQSMLPLLIGASFVHYLLYIAVFHLRESISFGEFKRDALLFRTVAHAMLLGLYVSTIASHGINWLSLGLILGGYGLASAATYALGLDQTYFGVELGQVQPRRVTSFPYNVVPHPMIVGTLVALVGYYVHGPMRELAPWLVPMHIAFYLVHLGQEMLDTRRAEAEAESGTGDT
ncbi:methyltransferase [Plesiocystis pacifica]|nr:methyltransferase [Plesiocystis pacifica]